MQIIKVVHTKGDGTPENPARSVTELWSLDGERLFAIDPLVKKMDHAIPYSEPRVFIEKVDPVVQRCLEIIEESGISAADAEAIPAELYGAILTHNRNVQSKQGFRREKSLFD